jgi:hypothetical protein
MKKTNLILLIAVAISTVSCVDNEVSPLVGAIRSQQVEWMKAKTAGQVALNDMQTILNAYTTATNAITLKNQESTYAANVAWNAYEIKQAEASLANANYNLQVTLMNLNRLVVQSGDIDAREYLAKYTETANSLTSKGSDLLDAQNSLVSYELMLSGSTTMLADFIALNQQDLAKEETTLAGLKEIKAILTDAKSNLSEASLQTEVTTLIAKNQVLLTDNTKQQLVINRIILVRNPLVTEKGLLQTEQDGLSSPADDVEIAALQDKIDALTDSIATLNDSIDAADNIIIENNNLIASNNNVINVVQTAIYSLYTTYYSETFMILMNNNNSAISYSENLIKNYKMNILFSDEKDAVVMANDNIATLKAYIATLNTEITALEKIVAYWKGLLDKIFTA